VSRVLVTGGSGFIGSNMVQFYLDKGIEVLNVDIAEPRNKFHIDVWENCDILDSASLSRTVQSYSPDTIIHLAARTDLDGLDVNDYAANTVGVKNIIDAINNTEKVTNAVFASSMLVCRIGYIPKRINEYVPSIAYGESKVIGEKYVYNSLRSDLNTVIIRPTSIWGPWFAKPYRDFFDIIKKGHYIHPSGINTIRSYGFVLNTVHQIYMLSKLKFDISEMFYLCDYNPTEIRNWAEIIRSKFGVRNIIEMPLDYIKTAAVFGDILGLFTIPFPINSFRLKNMLTNVVFNTKRLEKVCGQLPYTLDDGVLLTIDWINKIEK